jgi:hypothetical protein
MLVIALVALGWLVVNLYPGIWQEIARKRVATLIGIVVALTVIIVLLALGGASLGWTGFGDKTLWDWLQLLSTLAIPVVLAAAGLWFTSQQDARQQNIENQRARQAQKIENQRSEAERELAVQRAQDEALQAYLGEMSSLLLEKDLRASEEKSEVRTLARARTLTVLGRLDPSRKKVVMQFLVEAKLVQMQRVEGAREPIEPIIPLTGADLSNVNLPRALLGGAHLRNANLRNANLRNANLHDTVLVGANLSQADLSGAYLTYADLSGANLRETNLSNASLNGVADLSGANLSGANLSGAGLNYVGLNVVSGLTKEQLEQAPTPVGTIMPDGQYVTIRFKPAFHLELGADWEFPPSETPDEVFIQTGPRGGQLFFTNPSHLYDASNPSEQKKLPAPENSDEWLSWFQRHPNLDTSKPVPVSVGGASGMQIDVTVTSTPENYPKDLCGQNPCVPLYPTSNGEVFARPSDAGWKDRYVIVDVGGETVIINVSARAYQFDAFLPKAQKVLDTVEWSESE